MMASTTKYDRQLRLWGGAGQRALMDARICLLGAGPTGTEALKNLVLPGCGHVTIVDAGVVNTRDLANNFFVAPERVGEPRAKVVLELLLEMNPDVRGTFVQRDPLELANESPEFFDGFTLVVVTQLPEAALTRVAAACWARRVPLLAARTHGLIGLVRVQAEEHTIVEGRVERLDHGPRQSGADLHIGSPFPRLRAFVDSIHLSELDDMTFVHVPYIVLLVKALDAWRAGAGAGAGAGLRLPSSAAEKTALREALAALARPSIKPPPENFEEAGKFLYQACAMPMPLPPEVQAVLSHPSAATTDASTPPFWVVVRALREFLTPEDGASCTARPPPIPGTLPDMTSTTTLYTGLLRAYAEQAAEDAAAIGARVSALLIAAGSSGEAIHSDYVRTLCRNVRQLRVERLRPLAEEFDVRTAAHDVLQEALDDAAASGDAGNGGEGVESIAAQAPVAWYLTLRAADRFHQQHGRYPGAAEGGSSGDASRMRDGSPPPSNSSDASGGAVAGAAAGIASPAVGSDADKVLQAADAAEVWTHILSLARDLRLKLPEGVLNEKHAAEVTRWGGGGEEPHAVAALVGGAAAQEAVKLLTHQYTVVNNTFVFNGVAGRAGTLEL